MATNSPFPLIVPRSTELRMAHFDEQIYKGDSSTLLYKIVDALSGTAGAGALVNEILLTRLGTALETIYFNELDYIFGKINFLARSPAESYTYNPLVDLLTSDQWDEVRIKDAWYRQRITEFFAACNLGSTPDGIRTCVHAALAVDADVYEIWRFVDNYHTVGYLGRAEQPARNEIVVRPHKTELAPSEARLVRDMLDKVTTVDTIVTVNTSGLAVSTPVPLASACADSVYFEVQKMVTPTPVLDNLPPPEMLAIDLLPTETWMWSEDKTLAPYAAFNIAQESSYYYLVGGGSRSPIDSVSYGCADVETEILTLRGWLSYDEVTDEDICLTLNTDTGQSEWQPVRGVYIFPGQHEVIKMENLSHSSVTTRDHRWPVTFADNRSTPGWSWRTTETLTPKTRICAAAPVLAPDEPKWSDALVELVAWMWTEGHVRPHGGVVITQSQVANPENVMRIRAALTQVFGPAGELRVRSRPSWRESIYEPERGIVNFHLNKRAGQPLLLHAPNKVVSTAFLAELTRAQLELFIQVSIDADGSWRPKNNECAVLRQRDRARVDAFQVACTLAGKAGTVRQQADGTWAMCVTKSPWRGPAERKYVQQTTIDTPVWCVSTANRTWFARRNGTVYATRNTLQSDGSVRAEANFEVYESGNYYTSWTGYETADSPDNYPGGKYGTHPRRAPAKNPDGTPYRFPYASQADYVAKKKAEVIAMGGVATDDYYRLPITTGPQTRHAYLPEYAVAYTAPAKESQISSSITRRRVLSVTPEVRSPDVFTRSTG